MSSMNRTVLGTTLILIITICGTFLLSAGAGAVLPRIDMTAANAYTLSDGTKNIISKLRRPLEMRMFFSEFALEKTGNQEIRRFKAFHRYVRDLLQSYVEISDGKLTLLEFDPRAFSEEETEANRLGVARLAEIEKEGIYFGMAVVSPTGAETAIPFFNPAEQSQIEYNITEAIELVTQKQKKLVGVMSSLSVMGPNGDLSMPRQQGQEMPWGSLMQVAKFYDVVEVPADIDEIVNPETQIPLDTLVLIHPKDLPKQTLYAIDQFVMRGGKLLVFVDPSASFSDFAPPPQGRFQQRPEYDNGSDLNDLLTTWGVELMKPRQTADSVHTWEDGDTLQSLAATYYGSTATSVLNRIRAANPSVPWEQMQKGRTVQIPGTSSVVGDFDRAQELRGGVRLATLFSLNGEGNVGVNQDQPAMSGLGNDALLFFQPGSLRRTADEGSGIQFDTFLSSSETGVVFPFASRELQEQPLALQNPAAGTQAADNVFAAIEEWRAEHGRDVGAQVIAARVTGKFRSAFPKGRPKAGDDDESGDADTGNPEGRDEEEAPTPIGPEIPTELQGAGADEAQPTALPHVPQCNEGNSVIVCADVDMLGNQLAVLPQASPFGVVQRRISANADFLVNCLDVISDSTDLISVRARGDFRRTFERVEKIETEADKKVGEQAKEIQKQIADYQKQLAEMQQNLNQANQRALQTDALARKREIESKYRAEQKRLNELRRDKRAQVEELEEELKTYNLFLVPALVLLVGILVSIYRWNRRMAAKGAPA